MAEQFREDPTKKPETETSKQKAQEAVKPPEPSPEQKRMMGNQKAIGNATEMLYKTLSANTGDSSLWQDRTDTWRKNLKKALAEPRGSVTVERDDLIEPISVLAFRALRREDPKDKVSDGEAVASQQDKEAAHKALRLMLDRYPDRFELTDFSKANVMATASRLGQEIAQSQLYGDIGRQLDAVVTKKSTDNFRVISDIDAIIESLSMSLAGNAQENFEAGRVPKWDDSAKVLPQLKALMQLRGKLSLQLLGQYKSPDEVLAIQHAREAVGAADVVPGTKATKETVEERPKVKSTFNAADMAEMRDRAAAIRPRNEQGAQPAGQKPELSPQTEAVERERKEKEILDAILQDGPSQIHTSLRGEIVGEASSGLKSRADQKFGTEARIQNSPIFLDSSGRPNSDYGNQEIFSRLGVNEVVEFNRIQREEAVFEDVDVAKSGLMGMLGQKEKRREKVGTVSRAVMHADRVAGGKQEPLIEMTYRTLDDAKAPQFRDYSNRSGQLLNVTLRLPESLARKSMELMKSDPAFVRKMIEQVMLKQQGIPEGAWKDGERNAGFPLRPPYEKWSAQHGGKSKVYVRGDLDTPIDYKIHNEEIFSVE